MRPRISRLPEKSEDLLPWSYMITGLQPLKQLAIKSHTSCTSLGLLYGRIDAYRRSWGPLWKLQARLQLFDSRYQHRISSVTDLTRLFSLERGPSHIVYQTSL